MKSEILPALARPRFGARKATATTCVRKSRTAHGPILQLACLLLLSSADTASALQTVWLDFVSDSDPGDHVYTAAEQTQILDNLSIDYARFEFSFGLTVPALGPFSTLTFNADGIVGGQAAAFDFRNLDVADAAVINVNALLGGLGQPAATSANFVALSSTLGAHELGSLVGLRHSDSMGPIGSGISPVPGPGAFDPAYPGPAGADETRGHIMASPVSVGQSLLDALGDNFFSERSAIKLTFNESGSVLAEQGAAHDTLGTAQAIMLEALSVPNTIVSGDNAGATFAVDAVAVTGSIGAAAETDLYSFSGAVGDLMNFEVISSALGRIVDPIDSVISILDSGGSPVLHFGSTASNDDGFESSDSIIIDLTLPATDDYFIEVSAFGAADTGDYELFASRFAALPEPSAGSLLGVGLLGCVLLRTRPRASVR